MVGGRERERDVVGVGLHVLGCRVDILSKRERVKSFVVCFSARSWLSRAFDWQGS